MASSGAAKGDKVRLIGVGGVRQVSEASFDCLHLEMVHYFAQQISRQDSSATQEKQAIKLHNKLEVGAAPPLSSPPLSAAAATAPEPTAAESPSTARVTDVVFVSCCVRVIRGWGSVSGSVWPTGTRRTCTSWWTSWT